MIDRQLYETIYRHIYHTNKTVIITGQRRSGKTLLLKQFLTENDSYYNLEDPADCVLFSDISVDRLKMLFGTHPHFVILDEIQYLKNVDTMMELVRNHLPHITLLASRSVHSITGHNGGDDTMGKEVTLEIYPLTLREIIDISYPCNKIEQLVDNVKQTRINDLIPYLLTFGTIPEVFLVPQYERKRQLLQEYISSLLFKDLFIFEKIRNPTKLTRLTQLLAHRVGHLINPSELAQQLDVSRNTVLHYIDLLEKFSIITRIRAYSTRPQDEINKYFKVYFTDIGLLNAIIGDFRPIELRNPMTVEGLFENLVHNTLHTANKYGKTGEVIYFWRNRNGYGVDFILSNDEKNCITPINIEYADATHLTRAFIRSYGEKITIYHCITQHTLWQYI